MTEQALNRLAELQREYEVGQRRLQEIVAQEVSIRETLLRISGAIQILHELTGESGSSAPAQDSETSAPGTVLRVD